MDTCIHSYQMLLGLAPITNGSKKTQMLCMQPISPRLTSLLVKNCDKARNMVEYTNCKKVANHKWGAFAPALTNPRASDTRKYSQTCLLHTLYHSPHSGRKSRIVCSCHLQRCRIGCLLACIWGRWKNPETFQDISYLHMCGSWQ